MILEANRPKLPSQMLDASTLGLALPGVVALMFEFADGSELSGIGPSSDYIFPRDSSLDRDCVSRNAISGWQHVAVWKPRAAGYYEISVFILGAQLARVLVCLADEPEPPLLAALEEYEIAVSCLLADLQLELLKQEQLREEEGLATLRSRLDATRDRLDATEAVARTGSFRWKTSDGHQIWSRMNYALHGYDQSADSVSYDMCLDRLHPDDRDGFLATVNAAVAESREVEVEYRLLMPDGAVRYVFARAKPYRDGEWIGSLVDVTELRTAEDALRMTQDALSEASRVRTMGELAASIAHELNQPLTSIRANAGAASRWLKREPAIVEKVQSSLTSIIRDAKRGGDVIRNLLTMTLRSGPAIKTSLAQDIVQDVARLARPELIRQRIKLEIKADKEPSFVRADPGQIQQVLLNLVRNSAEAVESVNDGPRLVSIICGRDGEHVRLAVEDSGCGVGEADRQKLFDPFYSTKKNGMGMGLAICRSIVRHHKGSLEYQARQPRGSTFTMTLPSA
ncbi:serine/threonine kinase with two-component sensor domain [Sinorhizobium meliloti CCNWSX0020]|uniref:histidine kinase n=1 Tax=Sinorhizobium meliloti CCNWSX0020 TaxID=1107881 RepID=H0G2D7_RHIML|nr:ATP-binding protein [Sinorhizobium meliloti]EHK76494.1 serine/threonine kinase with two-component sensor domain [Sinorhizobium meliloti CCNWSX0020]